MRTFLTSYLACLYLDNPTLVRDGYTVVFELVGT